MEFSKTTLLICLVAVLCLCTFSSGDDVPMTCDLASTSDCILQCTPNIALNCTQMCGKQQKTCSMYCSENLACTQICLAASDDKCAHIKCTSKNCLQMCQGFACGDMECTHKEGDCMQDIITASGISSGVCNSKQCTQICATGNCDLNCGDSSTTCTQVAGNKSKVDCEANECTQGCYGGGKCEMECQKERDTKQSTICRQSASLQMGPPDGDDGQTPGTGGIPQPGPPPGQGGPLEATGKCYGENCEQVCVMGKCDLECTGSNSCQQAILSGMDTTTLKCDSKSCNQTCSGNKCDMTCSGDDCTQQCGSQVCDQTCTAKECNLVCTKNENTTMHCNLRCEGDDVNECNMDCNGDSECSFFCGNSKVCRKQGKIISNGSTLPVFSMAAVISAGIAHAYINEY